jgi:hypothetical protein
MAAALVSPAQRIAAQQLPFTVTIVDWQHTTFIRQVQEYRFEETGREEMFCVESWKTLPDSAGMERTVIEGVRHERVGDRLRIHDVGALCVGPKGEALPIIHTHAEGSCQFTSTDLITIVARRAPFDGIQCGKHHFVWVFAWQILAIANWIEMSTFKAR